MDVFYFGEIHEKIRILNLAIKPILGEQEYPQKAVEVLVKRNGVKIVKDYSEHDIPFHGFTVCQASEQSVRVVNDSEVHLRLQISPDSSTSVAFQKSDFDEDMLTSSNEEKNMNIICKKCLIPVTYMNRKFTRVLDLPSENWQDYLDNWCCHGNDAISKLKSTSDLNPQVHDCFLGVWYILIHPRAVDDEKLDIAKGETQVYQLFCKRCQAVLGELNFPTANQDTSPAYHHDLSASSSVKLYKYSVSLMLNGEDNSKDVFRGFGEEIYMGRKLLTLTRSSLCHKFIVASPKRDQRGKTCCFALLWIMNTDTRFLIPEDSSNSRADKNGNISAVKILYKNYLDDDFPKAKDEWYASQQTELITFPVEICLKLLLILNKNGKAQPLSMRHANGLNVSFLRL